MVVAVVVAVMAVVGGSLSVRAATRDKAEDDEYRGLDNAYDTDECKQ